MVRGKKIQPPASAGYEGLLFPPEQSEKIFSAYWPKSEAISNNLFLYCTARFSCILQEMHVFRQNVVTYWQSACSSGLQRGDLSTFHRLNCFPFAVGYR